MRGYRRGVASARLLLLLGSVAACGQSNKPADQSPRPTTAATTRPLTITVEAPSLAGADRLLRAEEPKIRECLGAAISGDQTGALAFSIGLDATGVVASVGVTRTGTISPLVASCVKAVLVDVTFDAPEGGATTINGRFVFAPGAAPQ